MRNFTGKHLCKSVFLINIKKRLQHRCFSVKCRKFLRTPILKNIYERLLLFFLGFTTIYNVFLGLLLQEINIVSEKIINYRVTSTSNHHCRQINIVVWERPGISVIMHFSLFLRHHSKIFKDIPREKAP